LEHLGLVVDLADVMTTEPQIMAPCGDFSQALWENFYPLGYHQNILAQWLQLQQISTQLVKSYIDVLSKLRTQLHILDLDIWLYIWLILINIVLTTKVGLTSSLQHHQRPILRQNLKHMCISISAYPSVL